MDKEIENAAAQYAALWAATWTEESILARAYAAGARYALNLMKTTDNIISLPHMGGRAERDRNNNQKESKMI